jgi:hypothetical protein
MAVGIPGLTLGLLEGGFSPAEVTFTTGMWLDPSDPVTGFQDSAGTTAGVINSPIGRRLDKSGRGNHVTQGTAAARPLWKVNGTVFSDLCDGTDDGYQNVTATFGTDMDLFVAIKRNSAGAGVTFSDAAAGVVVGAFNSAGGANGAISGTLGTPTIWVNNSQLAGGTAVLQTTLDAALPNGTWKVLEMRNVNLSSITGLRVGLFVGVQLNADVGGVIVSPAQSAAMRNKLRTWLGAKVGLSL